jgi:hypothetical protein
MKKIVLCLVIMNNINFYNLYSQEYKTFGLADGIPSSTFSCAQDSIGNIWFGGKSGISKWDGLKFTPLAYENELQIYQNNKYLFAENFWRGKTFLIVEDQLINIGSTKFSMKFCQGDYTFAMDVSGKLLQFEEGRFIAKPQIGEYRAHFIDSKHALWIAGSKGLFKYENNTWSAIPFAVKYPKKIFLFFEDRESNLWIPSSDGIYICSNNKWIVLEEFKDIANEISKVFQDMKGNIWLTTSLSGVFVLDTNRKVTNYREENGLFSDHIFDIIEDNKGNIWLAHYRAGVSVFADNKWESSKQGSGYYLNNPFIPEGWAEFPTIIFEDNVNNIWLICVGGDIMKYDGTKWEKIKHINDKNTKAEAFRSSKNKIWFKSLGGLVINGIGLGCYDLSTQKYTEIFNEDIFLIFEDKDGNMWFGAKNSIYCFPSK